LRCQAFIGGDTFRLDGNERFQLLQWLSTSNREHRGVRHAGLIKTVDFNYSNVNKLPNKKHFVLTPSCLIEKKTGFLII